MEVWAERAGADIIKHNEGSDPASVVFDGINAARARQSDIVIIDTAGRLQNKNNLMQELAKMKRVTGREIEGAPHEIWLTIDATTGQNGLSQAELFLKATEVTGVVLTKMDGTSRGGIVMAIKDQYKLPVRFITYGEDLDSITDFYLRGYLETVVDE